MSEQVEAINEFRLATLVHAEAAFFRILNERQREQILGMLIRSNGPYALLCSQILSKRLKATEDQINQLAALYAAPNLIATEHFLKDDLILSSLTLDEVMNNFRRGWTERNVKFKGDIWEITDKKKQLEKEAQEKAKKVLTPEQSTIMEYLVLQAPEVLRKDKE